MEFLAFLVVGLCVGWIAAVLVYGEGQNMFGGILLGMIGAFTGLAIFRMFNTSSYGFFGSIGMSVVRAVLFLILIGAYYKRRSQIGYNHK